MMARRPDTAATARKGQRPLRKQANRGRASPTSAFSIFRRGGQQVTPMNCARGSGVGRSRRAVEKAGIGSGSSRWASDCERALTGTERSLRQKTAGGVNVRGRRCSGRRPMVRLPAQCRCQTQPRLKRPNRPTHDLRQWSRQRPRTEAPGQGLIFRRIDRPTPVWAASRPIWRYEMASPRGPLDPGQRRQISWLHPFGNWFVFIDRSPNR